MEAGRRQSPRYAPGSVDDRADVLALEGSGDVARGEPVDDLDLLDVFGASHHLEHHDVDGEAGEVHRQELGGTDAADELRCAALDGRVAGEHAVDVLHVHRPGRTVGV